MPEPHKASLKQMLTAELDVALAKRPNLRLVKAADGANDNWTFLHGDVPPGDEVEARRRFAELRHVLLEEEGGVAVVIRSLVYLRDKHPRSKRIATELGYFRKRRRRMRYAEMKGPGPANRHRPHRSRVQDTGHPTAQTKRHALGPGRRQGNPQPAWPGAERALRPKPWALLAATFHAEVTLLTDVVSIRSRRL